MFLQEQHLNVSCLLVAAWPTLLVVQALECPWKSQMTVSGILKQFWVNCIPLPVQKLYNIFNIVTQGRRLSVGS